MKLPQWVRDPNLTPNQRAAAILRYRLLTAAAYHNPQASLVKLSEACGLFRTHLNVVACRGQISRKVALAVESVIGDNDVFAASMFD